MVKRFRATKVKVIFLRLHVTTLALGSRPRQTGLQGCGPRGSLGVTPHAPKNVGKCEGMNPHTPKVTPILEDGVPVDFCIFKRRLQGAKTQWLEKFLCH
jgi:hypothetical protein